MPKWIHDRAVNLKKDMEKTYGKDKAEQVAFAVATQQSHKLGKSPKKFKSKQTGKMERFGTPEGRRKAKAKFDKPTKEYKKTASSTSLETNELKTTGGEQSQLHPQKDEVKVNDVASFLAMINKDTSSWDDAKKLLDNIGEKQTFQRDHVVKNPTAEKPNTPDLTIKTAFFGVKAKDTLKFLGQPIAKVQKAIKPKKPVSSLAKLQSTRASAADKEHWKALRERAKKQGLIR